MPAPTPPDDRNWSARRQQTVLRVFDDWLAGRFGAVPRSGTMAAIMDAYDAGCRDGAGIADAAARRAVRDAGERGGGCEVFGPTEAEFGRLVAHDQAVREAEAEQNIPGG